MMIIIIYINIITNSISNCTKYNKISKNRKKEIKYIYSQLQQKKQKKKLNLIIIINSSY